MNEDNDEPGMSEEEIAALPDDPAELFDMAGCVSTASVRGDALLKGSKQGGTDYTRSIVPTLYHDFGCLLAPLYGEAQMAVLRAGSMVDDADLAEDGREDSPHITARYGIHPEVTPEVVGELLAAHGIGPIRLKLGKVGCLPGDEYDVLYLTVESPDLRHIHQITAALPHTDTHPHYRAHATICYVKPGLGKAYLGRIPAADLECEVPELEFHGPDSEGQGTAIAPE